MREQKEASLHYVYLLRCRDGSLYCGYSTDPVRRARVHNAGKGAKYTRAHLPVELVYTETFSTKQAAMSREWHLKRLTRAQKEALLRAAQHQTDFNQGGNNMNEPRKYTDYAVERAVELLSHDSPTGYTAEAEECLLSIFRGLDYAPIHTVKGGVLVDLGGKDSENGLLLEAHCDTLGAMVAEIKGSGRLRVVPLGGLPTVMVNTENCRVVTKFDGSYEGCFQICNASTHVNGDLRTTVPNYDNTEVVLDEPVSSAEDVKALGIGVGDIVCFDPRTRVTEKGYIKSRFLDDKLSAGILIGLARYLKDEGITPARRIWLHFTVYEEVGHGGAGSVPAGVTEAISVDMGCVGSGLQCTEHQVSICAKDSGGPYSYEIVRKLIAAAKAQGADYAVDVYPHYGSDVEATLGAGWDLRHGLIGPGVYASHGYERSHKDGVENTLKVLVGYINESSAALYE